MTRFLAILFLAIAAVCWHSGPSTAATLITAQPAAAAAGCADDGHAGAPAGKPMYAARRAAWAHPPPCLVPDVDYADGPDSTAVLVNPSTARLPAFLRWNAKEHRLDCGGGGNNIVIQNYDFSLVPGGSGGILINGCDNVTISNVKIVLNCNDPAHVPYPVRQLPNSTNIAITKVSVDAGGTRCQDETFYLNGAGTQSITYSKVTNALEHNITFACPSTCTAIAKYNSFSGTGFAQGVHANGIQFLGQQYTSYDLSHNYWFNPQPSRPLEASANLTIDTTKGSPMVTLHFAGAITQTSLLDGMTITSANLPAGTKLATHSTTNPQTIRLTQKATATASGASAAIPNAYPAGLASPIRVVAQGTAPMLGGKINGNVFDGDGPIRPGTNAIACGGGPGVEIKGGQVQGNYFNPAGYQAGFWTRDTHCLNLAGAGNKRLDTGATIPAP
jgi:hypothetical protein